jgi:adenine-specific DNA glycosylase
VDKFGGVIPRSVDELLTIPGIGRYTAGAIASIAFDQPEPIVDGNVARVLSRLFAHEGDVWPLAEAIVRASRSPRVLNQSLMELGALICKSRNPACLVCPVHDACVARVNGRVDEFPRPKPKKATRELTILSSRPRPPRPRAHAPRIGNADGRDVPPAARRHVAPRRKPFSTKSRKLLGTFRHTVTTRRIEFVVYAASVSRRPAGYEWIARVEGAAPVVRAEGAGTDRRIGPIGLIDG